MEKRTELGESRGESIPATCIRTPSFAFCQVNRFLCNSIMLSVSVIINQEKAQFLLRDCLKV